ncbi:MAG: hypothetical protein R3Y47_12615 [Lachnospiraceae bacterium]
MSKNRESFTIENYTKKSVFSSFLPGISGVKGTPIWCYYVNRGQGVVSFGVEDKDHAIMEFYPAHQAYQTAKRTGFRTFVRKNGSYFELFSDESIGQTMHIDRNLLSIEETHDVAKLHTEITYTTIPNEKVGGLVRKVEITNIDSDTVELEILDGMPAIVPYGVDLEALKTMGQTIKAWMQVEDLKTNIPYFKVRASTNDTATVTQVMGGNFSLAIDENNNLLQAIVDPDLVFGFDKALQTAHGFKEQGLDSLYENEQVISNQYPSSFYGIKKTLKPSESVVFYELVGQVENKTILKDFVAKGLTKAFFEDKEACSVLLTEQLCEVIHTKTAHKDFDAYSKYTYMDNVLRGGRPIKLPGDKIFYVYSRKHGDLERDYNYFRMLPEYYSQGNGNFRDVNQNRRMDNFFSPFVGEENIKKFYSMIQLDGYNPLAVEKVTYALDTESAELIFDTLTQEQKEEIIPFLSVAFTPGGFYSKMYELGIKDEVVVDEYFAKAMEQATDNLNCDFGEGYWSDHWTYNLDLVESYLAVYPERKQEMLLKQDYTYFCSQVPLLPRNERYVETDAGIRQYHFVDEEHMRTDGQKLVYSCEGSGKTVKVSLIEKLLVLSVTKYAALDAYGMGVEMEGGKPGWYDALNGLPGLFGSSMAETYELLRNLQFTKEAIETELESVSITKEVLDYIRDMDVITQKHIAQIIQGESLMAFWHDRNDRKEVYNALAFKGISGDKETCKAKELLSILESMISVVEKGIEKAVALTGDICPTYFTYEVEKYAKSRRGIIVNEFKVATVPSFLEGPVRYLKLDIPKSEKQALYTSVKNSDLYDEKLHMYKVNASLEDASFELGRAKAFTPGWLENESIWLHMEYKYLLELLKSGMHEEFLEDFQKAAVPFLDPEVYGRSILENSSFIASSKNPNPAYHGKGFVARLSGSTVEFLQMWKLMMFGKNTFHIEDGALTFSLEPTLPYALIGEEKVVEAMFMGHTKVIYCFEEAKDIIPGQYKIASMKLLYHDASTYATEKAFIKGNIASDVRDGKVKEIVVCVK